MSYEAKRVNVGGSVCRFVGKSLFRKVSNLTIVGATLAAGMMVAGSRAAQAQTESVIYSFNPAGGPDGANPQRELTYRKNNLYGTTPEGGSYGHGTVFEISPKGSETVLYNFTGGADGSGPLSRIAFDKAGDLYGTTIAGGAYGYGVVFKLDPTGVETILHNFNNDGTDGYSAQAGVVVDGQGNLYGTTYSGGSAGNGTVFEITAGGAENILYNFSGGNDGCKPFSPVTIGPKKTLYGTTPLCGALGYGTVFELTKGGVFTTMHTFSRYRNEDGATPEGGVILDKAGNVYGTTGWGGAYDEGALYKITPGGATSTLYSFSYGVTGVIDGWRPEGSLAWDKLGNLYGTTYQGGASNYGTVYRMDTAGNETVLYNFTGGTDGGQPSAGVVVVGTKNFLYGTTQYGGLAYGTVYKVTQ